MSMLAGWSFGRWIPLMMMMIRSSMFPIRILLDPLGALTTTGKMCRPRSISMFLLEFPPLDRKRKHQASDQDLSSTKRKRSKMPAPKYLSATSISGTDLFQSTAENSDGVAEHSQSPSLPYGIPNFLEFRSSPGMMFVDKTMFIERLEESQPQFRYLFLRPRRFGKSSFLNTLLVYYDIHTADIFNEVFGPLYIGRNPTKWRNQHLVLKFDLSSIVGDSDEQLENSFNRDINGTLIKFIKRYAEELETSSKADIINTGDATSSLYEVLNLVGDKNYTLFIGVDEYDAPVNSIRFLGTSTTTTRDRVAKIERFFNQRFFSVLKQACGMSRPGEKVVIQKYFLTGVLPAFRAGISPLAEAIPISAEHRIHGICGFTEKEVKALVKHFLKESELETDSIVWAMRKYYNGYSFADTMKSELESEKVYNPHLVLHYLRTYKDSGFVVNPKQSIQMHSTHVLQSISDTGGFSAQDLITLLVAGHINTEVQEEFGFTHLKNIGKDKGLTLSLLYYFGILTRCYQGLRIPNEVIKDEIINRIYPFLRSKDDIGKYIGPALDALQISIPDKFCELLEITFKDRAIRTAADDGESSFQLLVEGLVAGTPLVPQMCLDINGKGRHGHVDIFLLPENASANTAGFAIVLELKNFHLRGLAKGVYAPTFHQTTPEEMETLSECLEGETDEDLLARKYTFYLKDEKREETTTVGKTMENGRKQLREYMTTIMKGRVSPTDGGIYDRRVHVTPGTCRLVGFVIAAIGWKRAIWSRAAAIDAEYIYSPAKKPMQGQAH